MPLFKEELPPGLWLIKWIDRFQFGHNAGAAQVSASPQKLPIDSVDQLDKLTDGDVKVLLGGFDFSEVAATVSKQTMMEQIPSMLYALEESATFEEFFLSLINTMPATRDMVEATLLDLHKIGEDPRGGRKRRWIQGVRQPERRSRAAPATAALVRISTLRNTRPPSARVRNAEAARPLLAPTHTYTIPIVCSSASITTCS